MGTTTREKGRLALEFLKLSVISGLVFIASLIIILLILGWVYRDRIKTLFLETAGNRLRTEMYVDDIRLEMFRSFPKVSLTLNGLTLMEAGQSHPKDTLLKASRVQFQFRITDILRKDYILRQITISHGFLRIGHDEQGLANYRFMEREASDQPAPMKVDLQKVVLNELSLRYHHRQQNTIVEAGISRAVFSGLFSHDSLRMRITGDLDARLVMVDSTRIIDQKPVKLDMALLIENDSVYHLEKGRISINRHAFMIDGKLARLPGGFWCNTSLQGSRLVIHDLINDLPEGLQSILSAYSLRGELDFQGRIQGYYRDGIYPGIAMNFALRRGDIGLREAGVRLREVGLEGSYNSSSLPDRESASLSLKKVNATLNRGMVSGQVDITNFNQPVIDLKLKADISAPDLVNLLQIDTITHASGRILADIAFQGGMSNKKGFTGEDLIRARASGSIAAKNLGFSFRHSHLQYQELNGNLLFRGNDLLIESFQGKLGRSDFAISGYFRNVLPYLFIPDETIQVDASLRANRVDLDELLQDNSSAADTSYRLHFSDRLGFHLQATIGELSFRKFAATDVSGALSLQNKRFFAQDVKFRSMDGRVEASGFIDGSSPDRLHTGCQAALQAVDVHQLFHQMGNFGQTGILEENIFGIITSGFQFTANWTPSLQIDWGSLMVDAQIRIEDGVLVDYEPMNALGRFLRVDDLSRVTFSTLENLIRIRDRRVIIPEMEIKSNVLNLKLSGQHTFENQIEYYLQVLLSDILARKNRERRNPQEHYGDIIDDGLGRTTLFLKVTGHADDPQFRYDFQGVRQKISDDLRQERHNLRDALRDEFNSLIRQTPETTDTTNMSPRARRQLERERIRKQEEGKIIIEWEDL